MVSNMVTAPLFHPVSATRRLPAVTFTGGNPVKLSSGATPTRTSLALLYCLLIRIERQIGFRMFAWT
jgi:hypothetical protein